jgi:hypothetical protein
MVKPFSPCKATPKQSYQLGRVPDKQLDIPREVVGIKGTVQQVACGAVHTAALTSKKLILHRLTFIS